MSKTVTINGVAVAVPSGAVAYKYADPIEDARWIFDAAEASEITSEDPSLIVMVGESTTTTEGTKTMKFKDIEGKTIRSATQVKRPTFDDTGWLLLEFTDGSECIVCASYGGYTGESADEYPTGIGITSKTEGFVPVGPST